MFSLGYITVALNIPLCLYWSFTEGLQDLDSCTFDDPLVCQFEVNSTSQGSLYGWTRVTGSHDDNFDADGNYYGR